MAYQKTVLKKSKKFQKNSNYVLTIRVCNSIIKSCNRYATAQHKYSAGRRCATVSNDYDESLSDPTEVDEKLKSYLERLSNASRVRKPDKDKQGQLVVKAMGLRTMRQFANDLGVNVSSISRIVNGKTTEISDLLLAKIAIYADPDSRVTLSELMRAQGMISSRSPVHVYSKKFVDDARRIIVDSLLKTNYSVNYYQGPSDKHCDFGIITDALNKPDGIWLFECKMIPHNIRNNYGYYSIADEWLRKTAFTFFCGEKADRISLIIDDDSAYNYIVKQFSKYTIRDTISVILVSTDLGKVVDEYVIPLTDNRIAVRVFNHSDSDEEIEDSDKQNEDQENNQILFTAKGNEKNS